MGSGRPAQRLRLCPARMPSRAACPGLQHHNLLRPPRRAALGVYEQADFVAAACRQAGIPYVTLDSDLYGDFTQNFGRARVPSIPFWTLWEGGKVGRMPRQCTCEYTIRRIEKFVRYNLLCYRPYKRTLPLDVHAHSMHMGIMKEEERWAKQSKQILFEKCYPLVKCTGRGPTAMLTTGLCGGWKKGELLPVLSLPYQLLLPLYSGTRAGELRPGSPYRRVGGGTAGPPPLKSRLFLSKSRKRLRELSAEDCQDAQTFLYRGREIWSGF